MRPRQSDAKDRKGNMQTEVAETFKCGVCLRVASVEEGGADEHPEACVSCWAALTACATEAERIQHIEHMIGPHWGSGFSSDEYRQGWADAASIIAGRIRLIGQERCTCGTYSIDPRNPRSSIGTAVCLVHPK